jgi:succinoglycan biosynthesis transport protein ExoP
MASHLPMPADPSPSAPAPSTGPPPEYAPRVAAPDAGGGDLLRLAAAVYRRKWWVLAALLAGTGAGLAASRLVAPQYVAQGTVWVETTDRGGANTGPIRSAQLLQSYAWVELLKSYAVLDHVVREERLFVQPASPADARLLAGFALAERFSPGRYRLEVDANGGWVLYSADGAEVERGAAGAPVGAKAGFAWTPPAGALAPGRTVEFTVLNPRDVARGLAEGLETRMAEDGHFLNLSLRGSDPRRLAATLNTTMRRYVEVAAQLKRARLDELTAILEEQRQYAERNLRDAEIALEGFRVRTVTLPSTQSTPVAPGLALTRDPVFGSYFDMKVSREDLRRDRQALERITAQSATGEIGFDALAVIPAVQQNPEIVQLLAERTQKRAELRALQARYTDEHPPVLRLKEELAAAEGVTIPSAVRQLAAQIAGREGELESRIGSASSELRQIPPRAIEEARLQRRVEIAENLYGTLRQRFEEARLAAVSSLPDVRVLDQAAVPWAPVADRRPLIVGGFGAGALGLTLLMVLLLDRVDRRVRYPEQITGGMGLPVLGAVPTTRGAFAATGKNAAQIGEAFRELRLALAHAHGSAGPMLLSVASAESGDGKSTVAACLARAFAEQGHRTLLVDGDIRRGNLHRTLGCVRAPGLTDVLAGRVGARECITLPAGTRFALLPSGTRMRSGPELLGSPLMGQLLAELRGQYAVIIVDTPPLGAGVDAYVLGAATGNMLLVLRTGATDAALAEAKLTLLDRLPVRVLGAVLNAVPPSRLYRYYSYIPGYGVEDEARAIPETIPETVRETVPETVGV